MRRAMALLAVAWLGSADARAQESDQHLAAAATERDRCVQALRAENPKTAEQAADAADRAYRALLAGHPNDPRAKVGLARLLGQCRIMLVGFMSKGRVFDEARELLAQAHAADSTDWEARFTLAQLYRNAPDFLGHRKDAIRELETLLRQHRNRADFPEMATPYVMLGDLYAREKRTADAIRTWQEGRRLFPADSRLQQRLVIASSGRL